MDFDELALTECAKLYSLIQQTLEPENEYTSGYMSGYENALVHVIHSLTSLKFYTVADLHNKSKPYM